MNKAKGMLLTCTAAFLSAGLMSCSLTGAEEGVSPWSKILRKYPIDGIVYPDGVRKTTGNDYIVVGHTINTYPTGDGDEDAQAVRLSGDGTIIWAKTYGDAGRDHFYSVFPAADGYIVAGATNSGGADAFTNPYDAWIVKLNSDGSVAWQKRYAGLQEIRSIRPTADADWIVLGTTSDDQIAVMRLDDGGDIVWSMSYGGPGRDYGTVLEKTGDGGFIVAGRSESFGTGSFDYWLLKLTSDGDIDWQKVFISDGDQVIRGAVQTKDGGYLAAGNGFNGIWMLKLDADGVVTWQAKYVGGETVNMSGLVEADGGDYLAVGSVSRNGTRQLWIGRFDGGGDGLRWQRAYLSGGLTAGYTPWGFGDRSSRPATGDIWPPRRSPCIRARRASRCGF